MKKNIWMVLAAASLMTARDSCASQQIPIYTRPWHQKTPGSGSYRTACPPPRARAQGV